MVTTRDLLEEAWSKTEEASKNTFPQEIYLLETLIELFRSGFNSLNGLDQSDDAQRLRILQLNTSATFLEVGYIATLRGYYQPALACARGLLEHLASFFYFRKFPDQAGNVLNKSWRPKVATGLKCHPDKGTAGTLVEGYSDLSRATHPYATSLALGLTAGAYRVSSFDAGHARAAFGYLLDTGYRLVGFLGEEIHASDRNPTWLHLAQRTFDQWQSWHDEQERLLAQSRARERQSN